MCGRYTLYEPQDLADRFEATGQLPLFRPAYNIAPGAAAPVITAHSPNRASLMQWGLVPGWAKDPNIGYKMINARAEGIQDKPSYRKPIRSQRCLAPGNGFYEWQRITRNGKEEKVPHYIHLTDQETFAFAGIYDVWRDPEGRELATFAIVTTAPNALMAAIHNRMPVILRREDEALWLDSRTDLNRALALLAPYPADRMEAYPISRLVNSPRNDGPELIARPANTEPAP